MWSSIGSILGAVLFIKNSCDTFFEKYKCGIASYVDDNSPHTSDPDLYTVLSKLENCTDSLFIWFQEYGMKPNGGKCTSLSQLKNQLVSTFTEDCKNKERTCTKVFV